MARLHSRAGVLGVSMPTPCTTLPARDGPPPRPPGSSTLFWVRGPPAPSCPHLARIFGQMFPEPCCVLRTHLGACGPCPQGLPVTRETAVHSTDRWVFPLFHRFLFLLFLANSCASSRPHPPKPGCPLVHAEPHPAPLLGCCADDPGPSLPHREPDPDPDLGSCFSSPGMFLPLLCSLELVNLLIQSGGVFKGLTRVVPPGLRQQPEQTLGLLGTPGVLLG